MSEAYHISIFGNIQGVGFRPFIYNLAMRLKLKGYVQNTQNALFIYIEADLASAKDFIESIAKLAPKNAKIADIRLVKAHKEPLSKPFEIRDSTHTWQGDVISVPSDTSICEACLKDMQSNARFYQYAFSTCVNCGPRYSILSALPYDRANTAMRDMPMCEFCARDFHNPRNARFHAQPISCRICAIRLSIVSKSGKITRYKHINNDIKLIERIARYINSGKIIALKGIGGFNLVASANNINAISKLRARKNRPKKPFALMFKNIKDIESIAFVNKAEKIALLSKAAPIVLLERHFKNKKAIISEKALALIAPELSSIGAILPYSGLLHLLFQRLESPIIFTSANVSSEPLIADIATLIEKLGAKHNKVAVFDYALDYSRDIYHALDDSIVRYMGETMRPIRLARGYAPFNLATLQSKNNALFLTLGAQQKATFSLFSSQNALVSHYLGDLGGVESIARYQNELDFLSKLYQKDIDCVVCDMHPHYATSTLAKQLAEDKGISFHTLQHHKAHFYAILGEYNALHQNALGIIWDGTGFGEDGHIWGGEAFLYNAKSKTMQRFCHFKPFKLLGGESAIKDIGKLALSLAWSYKLSYKGHFSDITMLKSAYNSNIYPLTSSLGRIIDALAYMIGALKVQSYEGQSGALLESLALSHKRKMAKSADSSHHINDIAPYHFSIDNGIIDISQMLESVLFSSDSRALKAYKILETLAHIALNIAKLATKTHKNVYFSGGVFQNKLLCDRICYLFKREHIPCFMHRLLPCNDSCISFGQGVYALMINNNGATL